MRIQSITRSFRVVALALLAAGAGIGVSADVREIGGTAGPGVRVESAPEARLLGAWETLDDDHIHRLGPLSEAEIDELHGSSRFESASERTRVGIVRHLVVPVGFPRGTNARRDVLTIDGGRLTRSPKGNQVWSVGFASDGAGAMRLRLEDLLVPRGTVAFVYAVDGESHGPYALGGETPREFWTNTVFSDEVFLEIQFPGANIDWDSVTLSIAAVGHLEHEYFAPAHQSVTEQSLPGCFMDASCVAKDEFPEIDDAARAIAHISYMEGSGLFVCSAGLLNTTVGTSIPYLLTANHCVATPESAATVEAFWDYRSTSCGSTAALLSGIERTLGSTLLVTGSKERGKADFTLLRLSQQPPAGRYYLGWSAEKSAIEGGNVLYRLSHPAGGPQAFSAHKVSAVPTPGSCDGLPTSSFIYSKNVDGATRGGSSGAPLIRREGLKVVGQHFGRCGRNLDDACDAVGNSAVDGSFATYFEEVRPWLAPQVAETCKPTAVTLCLTGGRFRVDVLARDMRTGRGTTGTAMPQNDVFGYFSLPELTGQSENPEIFVKIVDGRAVNGKHWVFWSGLTDLQFSITVTDMNTGTVRSWQKDAGGYCGSSDTEAF